MAQPREAPLALDDALLQTLWRSPYPATLMDAQHRLVDVNPAFATFCGRSRESLIGLDPIELQPLEDRADVLAQRHWLPALDAAHSEVASVNRRMLDEQGRERWLTVVARRVLADNGRALWLLLLQDLTAEHQARAETRRAQDELGLWFELCPVGMLVYDDDGTVVRTNAAFEALTGGVLMGLGDAHLELQQLLGWQGSVGSQASPTVNPLPEREGTITLPDGRRKRLLVRVRVLPSDGQRRRHMAVVQDRSAEEERDVARLEVGALMDTASIGVATFDPTRGWLQAHVDEAPALPGQRGALTKSPSMQGIVRDVVEPSSRADYERLQQALRQQQRAEVRYAVNHPDTGRRWLLTRVEPARLRDGRSTLSVVTLDITEQELARERNEQLLRELSTILDGSTAGIAYLRGDALVRSNLRFERMMGFAPGESAGANLHEAFARRFDAHTLLQAVDESLASSGQHESEIQTLVAPGSDALPRWYSLSVRSAERGGSEARGPEKSGVEPGSHWREAVAVLTDITRLKAQQAELENVLRERELMFSLSEVGIAYMRGPRIERANAAMAALSGYAVPELTALEGVELYASTRECADFEAAVGKALRATGRFRGERLLRRRDAQLLWVQVAVRPVDERDISAGVITSFVDVDERHRARESLLQQAERTRAVLDSVLVGIVTVTAGGIEWMNRSARRMFGGELADFIGEDLSVVAGPDAGHPLRQSEQYLQRLAPGQTEAFECRLQARDGRQFWVVGNVVVTSHAASGAQLTFALLDIERRRQAEVRIAQAQSSLQRVIETAPLAIALFDMRSLRILQLNQMAASFFSLPVAQLQGALIEQVLPNANEHQLRAWLEAAALTPEVLRREWHDDTVPGAPRVWDTRIVALPASDASAAQLLLVASDVTEQRVADQAQLEAAISQRELLVREVHHRIKNNLQGVAGLLQQNAHRHPEMATLLGEAVSQVQAIAQVYGLQVGGDGPLRVGSVLAAIAMSVQRTFGRNIMVDAGDEAAQHLLLPEAEAIPIALTINELLTNAVKHSSAGVVMCSARSTADGVALHISNAGRLREGFSLQHIPGGVSGLGLVRALLPKRTASLSVEGQDTEHGPQVLARVVLREPSVRRPPSPTGS